MENERKGFLLVLCTSVISGISIWLNKSAVAGFAPIPFAAMKNAVVAVFLTSLLLYLCSNNKNIFRNLSGKDWLSLAAVGLVGGSVPFALFFTGLKLTSAVNAAFIHKLMFVFVGVFSSLFLKEKFDAKKIASLLLLLAGVYMLSGADAFSLSGADLLVLGATIMWGVEVVISKRLLSNLDAATVAWGRMLFGSLFLFAYLFMAGEPITLPSPSAPSAAWLLITSILLFGYVITFYSGLKHMSAFDASALLVLSPVVTLLLDATKGLAAVHILGSALIVAGVLLLCPASSKHLSISDN